jgi:sugar lactone lactonase YvrE
MMPTPIKLTATVAAVGGLIWLATKRSCRSRVLCRASLAEGLRWRARESSLYFADMHLGMVIRIRNGTAEPETVLQVEDDATSGIGWLPDGRLLVVLMMSRKVAALDKMELQQLSAGEGKVPTLSASRLASPWADVSGIQPLKANDLCVDDLGNAYLGGFGHNGAPDGSPQVDAQTSLTYLRATSAASTANEAADGRLLFPNGCVVTPDGGTLIVAETFGARLTAWDRDARTGRLSNRRTWAELPGTYPDGICLDREGAVWVAICAYVPFTSCVRPGVLLGASDLLRFLFTRRLPGAFVRVHEGGEISETIHLPKSQGIACMLGGANGTTLFTSCVGTSETLKCKALGKANGLLEAFEVAVGAATSSSNPDYWAGYC